jgi:hypothetical protein
MDNRIQELLDLAEAEGITLPYPPEVICTMEDTGAVVDLRSGEVILGEADRPYEWEWTPVGLAMVHLVACGLVEV